MVETKSLPRADMRAHAAEAYADRYRAPFSLRCGALLIDYIIVATIIVVTTLIARLFGGGSRFAGGTAETVGWVIAVCVTVLNFVVLAGLRGQTLGKWATGLRVVRMDGMPLTFLSSLLRHVVGYTISLLTLGLGFLLAVFNAHGRALHDIIAGTVVVIDKARRPPPPA
jgi:uncharacterized RDD family membrane protein YckC